MHRPHPNTSSLNQRTTQHQPRRFNLLKRPSDKIAIPATALSLTHRNYPRLRVNLMLPLMHHLARTELELPKKGVM